MGNNTKPKYSAGQTGIMSARLKYTLVITGACLLGALVTGALYFGAEHGYIDRIIAAINTDLSPVLFISLMILLPVLGFPISVFLVVGGIKFGIVLATALWLVVLPIHTIIGYLAVKFLRPWLQKLLNNTLGYDIPTIPPNRQALFSLLFLAIPAIPYAAKNYLLPMAGVSMRYCILLNCLVQSVLGLPFIILGKSGAEMDPTLFYVALLAFFALYLLLRWVKKKYRQESQSVERKEEAVNSQGR